MDLDDDSILDQLYDDWEGTLSHTTDIKDFFKTIKTDFPEIIFHGTDVGHQYNTTGRRYLQYLEDNNQKDSQEYLLTQEAIEQGEKYYKNGDDIYRENVMVENFIREFDSLDNKKK